MSTVPTRTNFSGWQTQERLGKGGQGEVFLAKKTPKPADIPVDRIMKAVRDAAGYVTGDKERGAQDLISILRDIVAEEVTSDCGQLGALKILHPSDDQTTVEKAAARMKHELDAQIKFEHPALVRILDTKPAEKWFVMEYFRRGTLNKNLRPFYGNVLAALHGLRPLVEAVSELHKNGFVHRDIKPANVFVHDDGHLVLGDFGLVFNLGGDGTRATWTHENVGSRDWMPPWAMIGRNEEVNPSFDVFSLAKVLWSMISGRHLLHLWYFDSPNFDIEQMFPQNLETRWATRIFRSCIVEHEAACLKDATEMLEKVNEAIEALKYGGQVLRKDNNNAIRCRMCGIGWLPVSIPMDGQDMNLRCNNCGFWHTFGDVKSLPGWEGQTPRQ